MWTKHALHQRACPLLATAQAQAQSLKHTYLICKVERATLIIIIIRRIWHHRIVLVGVTLFQKSFFFQKLNFDKTLQFSREIKVATTKKCKSSTFSRVFHPNFFLVKSKLSTAKTIQNRSIFTSFHTKQFDNFSREVKVEFLDKKMKISNSVWQKMFLILNIFSFPRYHLVMVS